MEFVRHWIEKSGYTAALGLRLDALSESSARLSLPYDDANSNPGKALHGGVAASLSAVGSQAVGRAALGPDSGPWHICALQVNYLSAAIGEAVVAEARLLRRGKEMCFVEVDVQTSGGKPIAHATSAVRGRFGAGESAPAHAAGDHGASDPGTMGPHIGSIPFVGNRGISVEHMTGGTSRLVMPFQAANGDSGGGVHEGAVLALLDTTGAMAAWAESGPGRYKASTPSIQAQLLMVPPQADLVAYGSCVRRDREIFFSAVDVATASDAVLVARGTVVYRILTDI
ncbi:MAG: PaaI family thioesterase [Deltaproteobacteria bacterium]|nr:MAG: PaaI family thioesterase [Deltaproteobacteria bacterium]